MNSKDTIQISFPIKTQTPYTEQEAVKSMIKGLGDLVKYGALVGKVDDFLLNYEITQPGGFAVATVKRTALVDPSKLNTEGAFLSFPVDIPTDEIQVGDRQFSASTIQERLRVSKLAPRAKFRLTVLDYQKYYKAKRTKLEKSPADMKRLKDMFLVDLMGIFTEILPYVQEGKQLSSLTGLATITEGLNQISRELSTAYRKALQQANRGQLSASAFKPLQQKYTQFVNALIPQVFPGCEGILEGLSNETRTHSTKQLGIVTVKTSNPKCISDLLTYIKGLGDKGHSFSIVVDPDCTEYKKSFSFDGDGSDRINSIEMTEVAEHNYSYDETGRIKLF